MILSKQELTGLVTFAITLTVAQALKLQLTNSLSLENFDKKWVLGTLGLLAGSVVNDLFTSNLLDRLNKSGTFNDSNMLYVTDVLNTTVLLTMQNVFVSLVGEGELNLSASWFRDLFLVLAGVLMYDVLIHPFVVKNIPQKYVTITSDVLKKTAAMAAVDYMSDLKFDDYPLEAGTTAAGIVIGDLTTTPVGDMLGN